jgi:hypothetical protein
MTIQVELSPEAEARLAAEAVLRGIRVEEYAGKLLQEAVSPHAADTGILKPGDIEAMTKALTKGSEKLPVLTPEANERSSYYEDR